MLSRRALAKVCGVSEASVRRWGFDDAMLELDDLAVITAKALLAGHPHLAPEIYGALKASWPPRPTFWLVSVGSNVSVMPDLRSLAAITESYPRTVIASPVGVWFQEYNQ